MCMMAVMAVIMVHVSGGVSWEVSKRVSEGAPGVSQDGGL